MKQFTLHRLQPTTISVVRARLLFLSFSLRQALLRLAETELVSFSYRQVALYDRRVFPSHVGS